MKNSMILARKFILFDFVRLNLLSYLALLNDDYHVSKASKFLLYICGLISYWDDRSWYFVISIYLVYVNESDLTLTAVFGFINSISLFLLGSIIGKWIDHSQRMSAVTLVLVVRNVCIAACAAIIIVYSQVVQPHNRTYVLLLQIGLVFFAVLTEIASMCNSLMITRDWMVVICRGDQTQMSNMSSILRVVDHVCNLTAPLIIGQMLTYFGEFVTSVFFASQVLTTLLLMNVFLRIIYRNVPRLAVKLDQPQQPVGESVSSQNDDRNVQDGASCCQRIRVFFYHFVSGWILYWRSAFFLAGLALSFLFMTVLSFDAITIGYGRSQGVSDAELSYFNAGAALFGILGALIFNLLRRCLGNIKCGVVGNWMQLAGLALCVWSVFARGSPFVLWCGTDSKSTGNTTLTFSGSESVHLIGEYSGNVAVTLPTMQTSPHIVATTTATRIYPGGLNPLTLSAILLFSGIVTSRAGLWTYDLSVTQIQLETIPESQRGQINSVQSAVNQFFSLVKFILVLVFPKPPQFGYLVLCTMAFILAAAGCYAIFALRNHCSMNYLRGRTNIDSQLSKSEREDHGDTSLLADSGN